MEKIIKQKNSVTLNTFAYDFGGKIKAGKYGLSSSMTYGEIINLICGINEEDEEGD